jgi:hypothetical protein
VLPVSRHSGAASNFGRQIITLEMYHGCQCRFHENCATAESSRNKRVTSKPADLLKSPLLAVVLVVAATGNYPVASPLKSAANLTQSAARFQIVA